MTTAPDDGPAPIDASLHLLVDHLVDALEQDGFPPALLHVTAGDAEGFDLGVLPLDGRHPSELLIGFTAPPDWHAIGIATGGWAYHCSERGSTERRRTRVHLATMMSRTGEFAHRTSIENADVIGVPSDADLAGEQPGGEQVDLLRLALGLPTDPPPCGTDVYWTILWLSEILGRPVDQLGSWDDVTDLHPALTTLRSGGHVDDAFVHADFVDIVASFGRVFGWGMLRSFVQDGRTEVEELLPADGAWFDDGAFSRFVLNRCPPLAMLRQQVADHLPPSLADRLLGTLERLRIPATAWPDGEARAA